MKKLLLLAICFIASCGPETQPKCFDELDCSVTSYCEELSTTEADLEDCKMGAHLVMLEYMKQLGCNRHTATYIPCLQEARKAGYSDYMGIDKESLPVAAKERSEAWVKAETYCKKHFKARGDADDFAQCIAEMTAYLEENEQ